MRVYYRNWHIDCVVVLAAGVEEMRGSTNLIKQKDALSFLLLFNERQGNIWDEGSISSHYVTCGSFEDAIPVGGHYTEVALISNKIAAMTDASSW